MISGAERIWELARGFQPSRVMLTGVELGVFAAIGEGSMTSSEVAAKIGADPRATDRLMNALVVLGLLAKENNLFSNTPDAREFLIPGKPGYIGGGLMHAAHLWHTWSTLTDAVKAGTSVYKRAESEAEEHARSFMAAMHMIAGGQAREIISQLSLENVRRVLDIGGGSGAYSIEFCRTKPGIESVVFDLPTITPITREYVDKVGLSERITTVTGDFNKDELPTGFDLAFLSQILHSNSPEENTDLIKKVFRSLNPGGQIVIQEFVVDEGRTSPSGPVFFALNMLVGTRAGDTFTANEISNWLVDAGFRSPQRIDPPGTNTTLITASRD